MANNFRVAIQAIRTEDADLLDNRHFALTLFAALVLHLIALIVWQHMPKPQVIEIPVRTLNIKLGDGGDIEPQPSAMEPKANNDNVENTLNQLVKPEEKPKPDIKTAPTKPSPKSSPSRAKVVGSFDRRAEGVKTAAPVMAVAETQFVRDLPKPDEGAKLAGESTGTSSAKDAEIISRYEQTISAWIEKFKVYPEEARKQGLQGDTVVRIRMDRRGNIHYYALERSTGAGELDRAAIDMVRRANPVPPVPAEYPAGEMLEFLIPVSFHLHG